MTALEVERKSALDTALIRLSRRLNPESVTETPLWVPIHDAPQETAYYSLADVIGFGGAAGGGKTDLAVGMTFTKHQQSIIFRAHFTDLDAIVERGNEILGGLSTFVWGNHRSWRLPDGRRVRLGAVDNEDDRFKYQGRPNDFAVFDEATQFREKVVRFLMGWVRTTNPLIQPQVLMTFNPPMDADGEWVIAYFAPWLDPDYPSGKAVAASALQGWPRSNLVTAKPGELRYFARIDDQDVEVSPDWCSVDPTTGTVMKPQSRTFIPSRVTDNPFYMQTDYASSLNMLDEPMRSQMLYGDFSIKPKDDAWQVIGSEHVRAAMKRGSETPKPDLALRAMGVDASRGGGDQTVIARIFGNWIEKLLVYPGKDVPDGWALAKLVEDQLTNGEAVTLIDVIGVGTSPYDILRNRKRRVYGVNFGAGSNQKDKTGTLQFANLRAEAYWRAREMLDPQSDWDICLPDDRELLVDLTAPRYNADGMKIRIEPKDDVKARIGRSPDKGDAVVMLLWGIYRGVGSALKIV